MTSEEYLKKLQPWIDVLDEKLGEVSFKNMAAFEKEIASELLKKLIEEIINLQIDKLAVSDVYDVYYALKTNVEEPYISFKFVKNSKGVFEIPYMSKEKWESWVETLYSRLSETEQQKVNKIVGNTRDYKKLFEAIKEVQKGSG